MTDLCTNMPDFFSIKRTTENQKTSQKNTAQNTTQNTADMFSDNKSETVLPLVDERFTQQKPGYSIH